MATQIINGFTCHAATWWRWLSEQAKDDMLRVPKINELILQAPTTQFYGTKVAIDAKDAASLFMSQILCALSHHENNFCYM
jgi:hypothetical protein